MTRRRYSVWGAWAAFIALLLVLVTSTAWLAVSYDGRCGGFQPWLAAARPCTLAEYVRLNLSVLALIVWNEFWPLIVVLLASPVALGYVLDRRRDRRSP